MLAARQSLCPREPAAGRWKLLVVERQLRRFRIVVEDGQPGGFEFFFRLLMVTAGEEERFRHGAGHFGQSSDELLLRLRCSQSCRFVGHLFEFVSGLLVVQIKRAGRNVETRVFLDQLFLFRRPFFRVCFASLAGCRLNVLGQFGQFFLERRLDELALFLGAFVEDRLGFLLDLCGFGLVGDRVERNAAGVWSFPLLPIVGWLEDRSQPVVIALRNWVVPVVVALGTANSQAEQ